MFGTPERFLAMVRAGYPVVYRAAGVTFRAGVLNIPMTFAVVPSKDGMRVSLLSGFTLRK